MKRLSSHRRRSVSRPPVEASPPRVRMPLPLPPSRSARRRLAATDPPAAAPQAEDELRPESPRPEALPACPPAATAIACEAVFRALRAHDRVMASLCDSSELLELTANTLAAARAVRRHSADGSAELTRCAVRALSWTKILTGRVCAERARWRFEFTAAQEALSGAEAAATFRSSLAAGAAASTRARGSRSGGMAASSSHAEAPAANRGSCGGSSSTGKWRGKGRPAQITTQTRKAREERKLSRKEGE